AVSLLNDTKSSKRPEPSSLGSTESLRHSSQGSAPLKKGDPLAQIWKVNIYTCLDELVVRGPRRCYRHRCAYPDTPPVASCQRSGGTVHRSITTPALTRCLLPTARGYYSSVGYRACPTTLLIASCRGSGRGLVWYIGSAASPVDKGDSWSTIGLSEDTPRSGRAEDIGSTWLSRDVVEMRTLCCSPRWT
ncbi:hypothetical protein BHE74_00021564, partial [Ensete ventricosum]